MQISGKYGQEQKNMATRRKYKMVTMKKVKVIEIIAIESKVRDEVMDKVKELENEAYVFGSIDTNDWEDKCDRVFVATGRREIRATK